MEEQVFIVAGGLENNDLLFHFSDHDNDLLAQKQWKGALNWIMPSLHLKNNDLALCARSLFLRRPRSSFSLWRHFTTTTIIPFVFPFLFKFCNPHGALITIALISIRKEKKTDSGSRNK